MSNALLRGGKMLSNICNECKAPLFEIDGEIKCLNCNTTASKKLKPKVKADSKIEDIKIVERNLREQLKEEKDPVKIKNILESIEKCVDLIKKLGENNES